MDFLDWEETRVCWSDVKYFQLFYMWFFHVGQQGPPGFDGPPGPKGKFYIKN